MFRKQTHLFSLHISGALLALMLLLSACNTVTNVPAPAATSAPTQAPADNAGQSAAAVTVDVSGVAQNVTSMVVAAVPSSANGPWWEVMPQYALLTLQGYPITDHLMQPQIYVYPVKDLGVNEVAGKTAESLQALLQSRQAGQSLPYLPPNNAAQVMAAQAQYLDFKNGSGVRYLTQFDQAPLPVNNHELLYTFQGLTSDGQYYVAVVLPVNLPGLPANENATGDLPADFMDNFPGYLAETVNLLNQQPASAFTPDLSRLDALVQSMEVK